MRVAFIIMTVAWVISTFNLIRSARAIRDLNKALEEKASRYVMVWEMDKSCFEQLKQADRIQLRKIK